MNAGVRSKAWKVLRVRRLSAVDQVDLAVKPGHGELAPVRGQRHAGRARYVWNRGCAGGEARSEAASARHVPGDRAALDARGVERAPVRAEPLVGDVVDVPLKGLDESAAAVVPDDDAAILRAGGERATVGAEGGAAHALVVASLQRAGAPRLEVEQADASIAVAQRERSAVGADCTRLRTGAVAADDPQALVVDRIRPAGRGEEQPPVRRAEKDRITRDRRHGAGASERSAAARIEATQGDRKPRIVGQPHDDDAASVPGVGRHDDEHRAREGRPQRDRAEQPLGPCIDEVQLRGAVLPGSWREADEGELLPSRGELEPVDLHAGRPMGADPLVAGGVEDRHVAVDVSERDEGPVGAEGEGRTSCRRRRS